MSGTGENNAPKTRAAFIGLGVMGYPMAGHLQRGGFDVCVYNRTAAKAEKWAGEYGGRVAATPAEAAAGCDFVCACVGADDDVRAVTTADGGAFHGMTRGATFIDHTTASAMVARELEQAAKEKRLHFLDAPVSGGQAGAQNGVLTIMAGGEEAVFERARKVLAVYGRVVTRMGEAGAGQLTKMVNQICIAGLLQALSEGLHFAGRAGLDAKQVVEVISGGAAQSWQMENRGRTMVDDEFDFGFAVDWMRKDLRLCMEEARRNGAELPVTVLVDQFYAMLQHIGGGRWDTSSLIRLLGRGGG
ncbi:MAG: NAD(P)-dependent oxidoreductase [Gammaproteobacteria bacterium]|nr:NAD(P)-dependent oxidoreductase [Gammaproteobacteria bacterium]